MLWRKFQLFYFHVVKTAPILLQISYSLPVPMNMTAYLSPSSANTLSTTIRVSKAPLLSSSGPPVRGRTTSSIRGRSLMNWRVLSGRSRERFIPILRATLLMHWNTKPQFRIVGFSDLPFTPASPLAATQSLDSPLLAWGLAPLQCTSPTWREMSPQQQVS